MWQILVFILFAGCVSMMPLQHPTETHINQSNQTIPEIGDSCEESSCGCGATINDNVSDEPLPICGGLS